MIKKRTVALFAGVCMAALLVGCADKTETSIWEDANGTVVDEQGNSDALGAEAEVSETVPEESSAETSGAGIADGIYGGHLEYASRDLIGTKDENGNLCTIIYNIELEDSVLNVYGSMEYKNGADSNPVSVSEDTCHSFAIDENTVFKTINVSETDEEFDKSSFANLLFNFCDTGMYLQVETSGGVATTVSVTDLAEKVE